MLKIHQQVVVVNFSTPVNSSQLASLVHANQLKPATTSQLSVALKYQSWNCDEPVGLECLPSIKLLDISTSSKYQQYFSGQFSSVQQSNLAEVIVRNATSGANKQNSDITDMDFVPVRITRQMRKQIGSSSESDSEPEQRRRPRTRAQVVPVARPEVMDQTVTHTVADAHKQAQKRVISSSSSESELEKRRRPRTRARNRSVRYVVSSSGSDNEESGKDTVISRKVAEKIQRLSHSSTEVQEQEKLSDHETVETQETSSIQRVVETTLDKEVLIEQQSCTEEKVTHNKELSQNKEITSEELKAEEIPKEEETEIKEEISVEEEKLATKEIPPEEQRLKKENEMLIKKQKLRELEMLVDDELSVLDTAVEAPEHQPDSRSNTQPQRPRSRTSVRSLSEGEIISDEENEQLPNKLDNKIPDLVQDISQLSTGSESSTSQSDSEEILEEVVDHKPKAHKHRRRKRNRGGKHKRRASYEISDMPNDGEPEQKRRRRKRKRHRGRKSLQDSEQSNVTEITDPQVEPTEIVETPPVEPEPSVGDASQQETSTKKRKLNLEDYRKLHQRNTTAPQTATQEEPMQPGKLAVLLFLLLREFLFDSLCL